MKFNLDLKDIRYIKLLYKTTFNSPILIKGAINYIDGNEIVVNFDKVSANDIQVPQVVTLNIICEDGLYRTKTTLKSFNCTDRYVIFHLELPETVEYQQNREYFRINVEYDCAYYASINDKIETIITKTKNISANGVSLIMPFETFPKENAELNIMVENRMICTKAYFVRMEKLKENSYLASFTYTNIDNSDVDYISQICIRKQLEYKRNQASQ